MSHNRKTPEPTLMSRVEEAFARADDFLTAQQVGAMADLDGHHTQSCIWWLHRVRAIDSLESDGLLWWFATPEEDQRSRKLEMRRKEDRPRRVRRTKLQKEG